MGLAAVADIIRCGSLEAARVSVSSFETRKSKMGPKLVEILFPPPLWCLLTIRSETRKVGDYGSTTILGEELILDVVLACDAELLTVAAGR